MKWNWTPYVEGLDGKNIMMFRREDVGVIVGTLLGEDPMNTDFEMDEIHISAICEVMNQMMGSSATALSEFLGTIVNISTPKSFDIGDPEDFKVKYFPEKDGMVVVRFRLEIEDKMNSEFMNIMSIALAKRLLEPFEDSFAAAGAASASAPEPAPASDSGSISQDEINEMLAGLPGIPSAPAPEASSSGGTMSQDAINAMLAGASAPVQPAPTPAPVPAPAPAPQPMPQQQMPVGQQPYYAPYPPSAGMDPMVMQLFTQMQQTQLQMMEMMKSVSANAKTSEPASSQKQPTGGSIIKPLASPPVKDESGDGEEDKTNQEMLMKVPLEISVEIGRTKRLVRDILEFTQGTLVVLDKMAGEQVDLFVNGQCIAKGDIVVVEDNFGIRITEIVSREINPESL